MHRAAWPTGAEVLAACGPADPGSGRFREVEALEFASAVLGAIPQKKSEEQKPLKTPAARVVVAAPAAQRALLALVSALSARGGDLSRSSTPPTPGRSPSTWSWAMPRPDRTAADEERSVEPLDRVSIAESSVAPWPKILGWGDVTTEATVHAAQQATGIILAKSPCVIAGIEVALDLPRSSIHRWLVHAARARRQQLRGRVTSSPTSRIAASLLTAERTALNFLQRLSGIATLTRRSSTPRRRITVLDTRKTTPTLRALEKYAVRAGGGTQSPQRARRRRADQGQPLRLAGGVARRVRRMKASRPRDADRDRGAVARSRSTRRWPPGADIILLDNLSTDDIREAVRRARGRAKSRSPAASRSSACPSWPETGADLRVGRRAHSLGPSRGLELRARARLSDAPPSGSLPAAPPGSTRGGAARASLRRSRVYYFSATGCTNDVAGDPALDPGAAEGTLVLALGPDRRPRPAAAASGTRRRTRALLLRWCSFRSLGRWSSFLTASAGGVAVAEGVRRANGPARPPRSCWPEHRRDPNARGQAAASWPASWPRPRRVRTACSMQSCSGSALTCKRRPYPPELADMAILARDGDWVARSTEVRCLAETSGLRSSAR